MIATLVLTSAFVQPPTVQRTPPLVVQRTPLSPRLCAPAESLRTFDAAEEKALRKVRLDFGGYPAGPYYLIEQDEGAPAAYAKVRSDFPILESWADDEIKDVVNDLKSTPAELLIYSPIGPFLVLSAISIWRDGMAPWGIPPCKAYVGFCQALAGGS